MHMVYHLSFLCLAVIHVNDSKLPTAFYAHFHIPKPNPSTPKSESSKSIAHTQSKSASFTFFLSSTQTETHTNTDTQTTSYIPMEQDEDTSTMSPFWVPNDNRRRLRRSYSLLLTSTSFLVLLLVTALVFGLVVLPTLRSFTSNIFRPNAVKHSWDSLNLILVLFAVVCGFLARNDTNETQTPRFGNYHHQRSFSNPATPPSWYENNNRSFNRLRSFGSYPDLRQHSPWVADDERCRFYDDTHPLLRHRYPRLEAEEEPVTKNVTTIPLGEVSGSPEPDSRSKDVRRNVESTYQAEPIEKPENNDLVAENSQPPLPPQPAVRKKKRGIATVATVTSMEFSTPPALEPEVEPQPTSAPPPPATRTKAVRKNAKRTYQAENNDFVAENSQPPPPSPPLLAERKTDMQVKKKRGSATKEFLTSLRGKKKKQRQRSVENFETILNSQYFPRVSQPPPSPPPPPPPPPPPAVFQNLFSSNKSKYKKHYLVPVGTNKPRLPNKREHSYHSLEDNVRITGNESPLIPIPPPPPPPPFKLPAWKFRVQGDFVRVDSIGSSRSGSPDFDEAVESPISQEETNQSNSNSPYAPDEIASASGASLFCPSPDVDTKAQNFIQSFRAGLRIAKMNSMKEKHGIGRSNLGPLPNP